MGSATVLRSTLAYARNAGDPLNAWDLDAIRASYEDFLREFTPLLERVNRGAVGSAEALVARTAAKDAWREIISIDPDLPDDLLPPAWPGPQARRVFARIYDSLGQLAEVRFRQLLADHDPALAEHAGHRTTTTRTPT